MKSLSGRNKSKVLVKDLLLVKIGIGMSSESVALEICNLQICCLYKISINNHEKPQRVGGTRVKYQ